MKIILLAEENKEAARDFLGTNFGGYRNDEVSYFTAGGVLKTAKYGDVLVDVYGDVFRIPYVQYTFMELVMAEQRASGSIIPVLKEWAEEFMARGHDSASGWVLISSTRWTNVYRWTCKCGKRFHVTSDICGNETELGEEIGDCPTLTVDPVDITDYLHERLHVLRSGLSAKQIKIKKRDQGNG